MESTSGDAYHVYILRMWRERPARQGRPAVWRFALLDVRNGVQRGFGSLEEATIFLRACMEGKEICSEK